MSTADARFREELNVSVPFILPPDLPNMEPEPESGSSPPPQMEDAKDEEGKPARRRCRACHKTDWVLEILSSIFSVLCLIGIAILLACIQGRRLSTWTLAVSPNAFISVLSTASKAFLILPVSECLSQLKWWHLLRSKRSNRYNSLFSDSA